MKLYQILLGIIILAWSVPIGIILKSVTKEEITSGRKYFLAIWVISLALIPFIIFLISDKIIIYSVVFSLIFIAIVSFISWLK